MSCLKFFLDDNKQEYKDFLGGYGVSAISYLVSAGKNITKKGA